MYFLALSAESSQERWQSSINVHVWYPDLGFLHHSSTKINQIPWRNGWAGNIQDESGASSGAKSKDVLKEQIDGDVSHSIGAN